jgi:hypothetical protein
MCTGAEVFEEDVTYEVTGVTKDNPLTVRSDAAESSAPVTILQNGKGGIVILGPPVMNGKDDWVRISFPEGEGWVRPKYLRRQQTLPKRMPANNGQDDETKASGASVVPDQRTIEVWREYSQIREESRSNTGPAPPEPEPELIALQKLDYKGASSVVTQQIQDNIACLREISASNAKARPIIASQQMQREFLEVLRPQARKLGERLMPETGAPEEMRSETGKALGELMLMYVFSSPQNTKERENFYVMLRIQDRLVMQESLINAALGLEDSGSLRTWLSHVRDRACATRLLDGTWESREVNGRAASLRFSTDPKSFVIGSGHLEMVRDSGRRSRNPGLGDKDDFDWQFIEGVFSMAEIGWGQIGGLPKVWRTFRAVFTSPGVFEISDEKGVRIGTWKRLD